MWHLTKLSEAEQLKKAFAVKILAGSAKISKLTPLALARLAVTAFFLSPHLWVIWAATSLPLAVSSLVLPQF